MATTHTTDMPVAHEKPVAMTPEMQGSPHVDDRIDTPPLEGSDDGGKLEPVLTSASQSTPLNEQPVAKRAIVMLGLCLAVFLAALDVTIVTVAIPTIADDFKAASGYVWIGSGFTLASAASTPIWAKVSDIFGRNPLLLMANAIFMVGSLIAALSINMGMLIAARVIQGIGAGGLLVLVNICISDLVALNARGLYYGVIGAVWAVASSIGPVIGGAFTQKVTWRWCFYINLPVDGLAFGIILFFVKINSPRTPIFEGLKAIDWLGALTVVGATLMLLFGLEYGGIEYPWKSATVICLIVFGIVAFGLFFLIEAKFAKYPILPLGIFKNRTNAAVLGVCFFHGMVFIASSYYLPLFFQICRSATPILSGVYTLPFCLSLAVGAMGTGIVIKKTQKFVPLILGGWFFLVLGSGLYTNLYADSGWAKIILYQILVGLGVGPIFQAPLIAIQAHTAPRDISTATMAYAFTRNLAVSIGIVIGNVVWQNEFNKYTPQLNNLLGPQTASRLSGNGIAAQANLVKSLPVAQRTGVQDYFGRALHPMWIMFVCFAAVGFLIAFLIQPKTLDREHKVVKTGLADEAANRAEREEEARQKSDAREQKRMSKMSAKRGGSTDAALAEKGMSQ